MKNLTRPFSQRLGMIAVFFLSLGLSACGTAKYEAADTRVELDKYMGTWYVWTGRTTSFEQGAYAAIENYTWNEAERRIDIDFSFHEGSFDGKLKKLPQKAWIAEKATNTKWKVQPFWPLKFDYLILDFDPDYQWTIVGVPDGSYLWIMGRQPVISDQKLAEIVGRVQRMGYPIDHLVRVPQR